jgi:phytoene dehydrogenase-like protein
LGKISHKYENFINAQLLITVQSTYQTIPLLSMALGLAYPFHKVYYVNGGMGSLIESLLKEINVHTQEEVVSVYKDKKFYRIITNKQEYCAYKVVLNSTVYDSGKLFVQENIQNYYQQFSLHDQSAFVLYMTLQSQEEFLHHYQIILDKMIPHTISNHFFVSFSDQYDEKLSKNGYSITISCHTKALFWKELNQNEYQEKKSETQEYLVQAFFDHFKTLQRQNMVCCFSATSKTFQHYTHRLNCGGNKLSLKTFLSLPCASTPFDGLYNVGDTLFSGQGWPGVALGVETLHKELNE